LYSFFVQIFIIFIYNAYGCCLCAVSMQLLCILRSPFAVVKVKVEKVIHETHKMKYELHIHGGDESVLTWVSNNLALTTC
jgi:hypothetical protein